MESLTDDVLGLILERVSDGRDRKSCSQVCTLWFTIEAQTRTRVRVRDPRHLPYFLPRFPNLTTLVAHERMNDEALMFVGSLCPNLRTLDLQSLQSSRLTPFGDEGLVAVATGCRLLENVSLLSINVGDKGIAALQMYAKGIAVLELSSSCLITDTSLAAIGDMESLSELHVQDCPLVTDTGLRSLSRGPASRSLRVLTLANCERITDVGVRHLRNLSRLEELDLQGPSEQSDVGGVAVSFISSLKKLNLSWQYVPDETLSAVAEGCRNLVDINLAGCDGITGRGLVSLASSLSLERIDLSRLVKYGRITSSELSYREIVQIVKECPSLKHMIADKELKKGLPRSQWKKLRGHSCRFEWV